MAKQVPKSPSSNSRVKVRVFEFEMDGSDDSIQDTMKTLAAAFSKGGTGSVPIARRLKSDNPATQQAADSTDSSEELESDLEDDDNVVEDVVARTPSQPKKPRKVKTYDVLDDIRFDVVEPNLSDFVARLSPKNDLKKYLVIALWYKEHLKLPEINIRHWYTAFKYLKWALPDDPDGPIRNLRSMKKLSKGKEIGHSFINHIGEKDLDTLNGG